MNGLDCRRRAVATHGERRRRDDTFVRRQLIADENRCVRAAKGAARDREPLRQLVSDLIRECRVAAGVRPLDDFGTLVVVPEDEQLRAEGGLGGADPLVDLLARREGVPVRQEGLESQHGCDPFREAPVAAGGDSLVAHRGVVGPGTDMWPECQAGLRVV